MFFLSCTFTISTPDKPKSKPATHGLVRHKQHKSITSKTVEVDSAWLLTYQKLQTEHGDYTIPDDNKIQPLPNGKFQIPITLLKHFKDLSQTPGATPTP